MIINDNVYQSYINYINFASVKSGVSFLRLIKYFYNKKMVLTGRPGRKERILYLQEKKRIQTIQKCISLCVLL